jgi:hypothetical protein
MCYTAFLPFVFESQNCLLCWVSDPCPLNNTGTHNIGLMELRLWRWARVQLARLMEVRPCM